MSHFKVPGTCNYEAVFHAAVHMLCDMPNWSWDADFDGWLSLNMTILTNSLLELLSYFTCIEAIQNILCCIVSGLWIFEVGLSQVFLKWIFQGCQIIPRFRCFWWWMFISSEWKGRVLLCMEWLVGPPNLLSKFVSFTCHNRLQVED